MNPKHQPNRSTVRRNNNASRGSEGPAPRLRMDLLITEHPVLKHILFAVFQDCKAHYPSRSVYDADYKRLQRCTLLDLHRAWKEVNSSLAQGGHAKCALLSFCPTRPSGVRALRQLVGIFSRLEGVCDSSQAIEEWATRVASVRNYCPDPEIAARASRYIRGWLGANPPHLLDLMPKHGPGAVATGEKGWQKWSFSTTYRQLDWYLARGWSYHVTPPSVSLFYCNKHHMEVKASRFTIDKHGITKVVAVPKDLTKPRIISCEPLSLQYLQQGVARCMMDRLAKRDTPIEFRDQSINGLKCRDYETWASLDLSEASDRVSRRLVHQLFPKSWWRLLTAVRSHAAQLPDGRIVPLRSFSPMGSATCFPVEAVVFASLVDAFLATRFEGDWRCYVYGDDILVPRQFAPEVMEFLHSCGMIPNLSKCCYNGSFRESCGFEWYDGVDVTVVRPKSLNPMTASVSFRERTADLPMVGHANALYRNGFPTAAQAFASMCTFPVSPGSAPWSAHPMLDWPCQGRRRWNADYQREEQQILSATVGRRIQGEEWPRLFAWLAAGWSRGVPDRHSLRITKKWVPLVP